MADSRPRAAAPGGGGGDARRRRLEALYARISALRALRRRLDSRDGGHPRQVDPADLTTAARQSVEQVDRAIASRRVLAHLAQSMAKVEDEVADVLDDLAETSPPAAAVRRRELARLARLNAEHEREQASALDQPPGA